jgi:hypothetical protein
MPFGGIQHLTNDGRDWVIVKLQFRVPYDTDLRRLKKILKKIRAESAAGPVIGPAEQEQETATMQRAASSARRSVRPGSGRGHRGKCRVARVAPQADGGVPS